VFLVFVLVSFFVLKQTLYVINFLLLVPAVIICYKNAYVSNGDWRCDVWHDKWGLFFVRDKVIETKSKNENLQTDKIQKHESLLNFKLKILFSSFFIFFFPLFHHLQPHLHYTRKTYIKHSNSLIKFSFFISIKIFFSTRFNLFPIPNPNHTQTLKSP